jgi:colicin import membrane protein
VSHSATMTADNSRAFFVSVLLHALVLAVAIYFSYATAAERAKKAPRILELVAGEGNNFRATEAPLLGVPGGVKVDIPKTTPTATEPKAESPRPEPPKPITPKAESIPTPPPVTKATTPAKESPPRSILKQIQRQMVVADIKSRRQVQKEREAEQKRITKEEFDKAQKAKVASAKSPTQKVEKINTEGLTGGVVGGSKNNKTGGAGGTALTVAERSEAEAYVAFLNKQLTDELEQVTGLDEGLTAEAEFEVQSNGRLARGKVTRSSGNERFDSAVRHAIAAVRMPEGPPKGVERMQSVTFHSQGKN